MPQLSKTRFVLAVPRLQDAVAFYQGTLGMTLDFQADGWAFLSRDAFAVMLGECPDATPAHDIGDHSYFAYVTVQAIDELHAELAARGADFIKPLRDEAWGMREFGLSTPDGHRIMFGQELD